jgi:putative membrane protein
MIVAGIITGFYIESIQIALLSAVILTLINSVVKPFLVILTLPITVLTLGLFLLVINALTLLLTQWLIPGFNIDSFWIAVLAGIIIGFFNMLIQKVVVDRFKKQRFS